MPIQPILPKAWRTPGEAMEQNQPTQGHPAHSMEPDVDPRDAAMQRALDTNTVNNVSTSDEVHDVASDPSIVSRLDWEVWLPFAAQQYHISPRISDYLIVSTLVCPSEIPNRNGIAFPTDELAKFRLPPTNRLVWEAWKGCPVCCFPAGTKIQTRSGQVNIEDISVGDEVWTHEGRYKKVSHLINNGVQPLMRIDAVGLSTPIRATSNHPFWVVDRRQVFSGVGSREYNISKRPETVTPHFRPLTDVYSSDYLVISISIGGEISVSPEFAFLTGLYAAEGSILPSNTSENPTHTVITLGISESELRDKTLECVERLGMSSAVSYNSKKNTCTILIKNSEFSQKMRELVGVYSHEKRMRGELRSWDSESIKHFLGGYISGDGTIKGPRLRCRTVSEDLAIDVQQAFGFVGIPASANNDAASWHSWLHSDQVRTGEKRKGKGGKPFREDTSSFCVGVSFDYVPELLPYLVGKKFSKRNKGNEKGSKILVVGKLILLPICKIEEDVAEQVYNFEVEDDHTYVAGGVVVHNCEHDNEDPTKAIGVILDTSFQKVKGYGGGKVWKVMGLLAIDKTKNPEIARKVLEGKINTYSMGALVDYFTCSYCGAECSDRYTCSHIRSTKAVNWNKYRDFDGSTHIAFLNAHGIQPIEVSVVADPAWAPALSDQVFDPFSPSGRNGPLSK